MLNDLMIDFGSQTDMMIIMLMLTATKMAGVDFFSKSDFSFLKNSVKSCRGMINQLTNLFYSDG